MKTLCLDIETAPHLVTAWGLWGQNIATNQILETGYTLCFSAKWMGEKEIIFDSIHESTPKKMIGRLHKLMDEADAVVTYNGMKFDVPTVNKEFVLHGFRPPAPYKQIDLYQVVKRQFRFASNKLDFIASQLGLGHKVRHAGHQMWLDTMKGDEAAWREMKKYNIQDVALLENLYYKLLPWIQNHPNVALIDRAGLACPACNSVKLQRRGYAYTTCNRYVRLRCSDCGTWSREAQAQSSLEERQKLYRRVA